MRKTSLANVNVYARHPWLTTMAAEGVKTLERAKFRCQVAHNSWTTGLRRVYHLYPSYGLYFTSISLVTAL